MDQAGWLTECDLAVLERPELTTWREQLMSAPSQAALHGDWPHWRETLAALPDTRPECVDFRAETVTVGAVEQLDEEQRARLRSTLQRLHPWRKGPFSLYGVVIDAEWRSNLKWRRVQAGIAPLAGRRIFDVGCGNGYYLWRMLGEGAASAVGIDPTLSHVIQFRAVSRLAGAYPVAVLPLGIDAVPDDLQAFDTVFSMGVLYHRRSPLDHLFKLRGCLRSGGQLVLETLVIEGALGEVLVPEDRYAQMRNVWFIPTCLSLESWLKRCGFRDVTLIDVARTTIDEQRATAWMRFQSLADFLMPGDSDRTVEGYPAPHRALFVASVP